MLEPSLKEYKIWYGKTYASCYSCGWEGIQSELIKVKKKVVGPMFGQLTTAYKCPNCKKIVQYDGESLP